MNGTLAVNGSFLTNFSHINVNYSCVEQCDQSMVYAHCAILNTYFHDAVLFTNDVTLQQMNHNISNRLLA